MELLKLNPNYHKHFTDNRKKIGRSHYTNKNTNNKCEKKVYGYIHTADITFNNNNFIKKSM